MTGSQYKNVAQWTLANTTTDDTANDTAAVKAVFDNCGVAFPSGDSEEVLMTLMTDEYMGWENCTYAQAQEAANNGIATVGVDADHVVIILPDDTVSSNETIAETESSVARTVSEISTTERSTMQFFAYTASTTRSWSYWANRVVSYANAVIDSKEADFKKDGKYYDSSIEFHSGEWCVDFVRWCCKKAGVYKSDIIENYSSTTNLHNWYQNTSTQSGTLHIGYTGIQPGDIVFIKRNGSFAHTCIASSTAYNGKVDTINGNWGGEVKEQTFPYKNDVIDSYAHPHYERA